MSTRGSPDLQFYKRAALAALELDIVEHAPEVRRREQTGAKLVLGAQQPQGTSSQHDLLLGRLEQPLLQREQLLRALADHAAADHVGHARLGNHDVVVPVVKVGEVVVHRLLVDPHRRLEVARRQLDVETCRAQLRGSRGQPSAS